ncbi:MAG: SDR family oxidoreductase [Sandaracinaceae bacterium]|nr:SDR family oxidoreductase [Sandaracinaceae bacterium]
MLVTGASSGIGEGIARVFAREGYDVTLVARREAELARVAAELPTTVRHAILVADVTKLEELDGLVSRAEEALPGPIDVLVNNAGVQIVAPTGGRRPRGRRAALARERARAVPAHARRALAHDPAQERDDRGHLVHVGARADAGHVPLQRQQGRHRRGFRVAARRGPPARPARRHGVPGAGRHAHGQRGGRSLRGGSDGALAGRRHHHARGAGARRGAEEARARDLPAPPTRSRACSPASRGSSWTASSPRPKALPSGE